MLRKVDVIGCGLWPAAMVFAGAAASLDEKNWAGYEMGLWAAFALQHSCGLGGVALYLLRISCRYGPACCSFMRLIGGRAVGQR